MSFNKDERRRFEGLLNFLARSAQDTENARIMKKRERDRLESESRLEAELQRVASEIRERKAEERKRKAIEEQNQLRRLAEQIRSGLVDGLLDESWRAFLRHDWVEMNRYFALYWLCVSQG